MVISLQVVKNYSVALLSTLSLTACSVGMALDGQKDPDVSVIRKDVHRTDIEVQLGSPIKVDTHSDGYTTAIYEYEIGKEPSAGRAVAHGVMDVLTLGLWEVVGTPVERLKGDKITMVITYDTEGRVDSASRSK